MTRAHRLQCPALHEGARCQRTANGPGYCSAHDPRKSSTPFEQQVAQALASLVVTRKPAGKTRLGMMLAAQLAPRVAAAIEAASPETGNDVISYQDIDYEAALAALRGQS